MKRRRPGPRSARQQAWASSDRFKAIGRASCLRLNRERALLPHCGAIAKRSGEPCGNPAMANGRCRFHGGRTPSGSDWHKPQWPDANSPRAEQRLAAKLNDRERAAKARQRKLSAMKPDEFAQHQRWHRDHKPGSAEKRAAARAERKANAELRGRMQRPDTRKLTAEARALAARISELEAERVQLREAITFDDDGVFG